MIVLKNVCKTYIKNHESTEAIKNINLNLPSKGLVFINGQSGCGKTTLLNIISKIDTPTEGIIDVSYTKSNYCAIIFQDFKLISYLTLFENLMLITKLNNKAEAEIYEIAKKCCIEKILNKYPNEVSGGEKERCAIARAILFDKPVLICDEVTSNLDDENTKIILEILKEESKKRLVIAVSHNMEFKNVSDIDISMKNGEIEEINKKNDVIENDALIVENDIKFNFDTIIFLMKKFLRKNILKHIFLVISICFSFALLLVAINGLLSSKAKIIYNAYKDVDFFDFSLDDSLGEESCLSLKELEKYQNKGNTIFYDYDINLMDVVVERVYISSSTKRHILYGKNDIGNNEILISDFVASKLSCNIEELIDRKIDNFIIKGIYQTNYQNVKLESDRFTFLSMYMTSDTFDMLYFSDSITTNIKIGDKKRNIYLHQTPLPEFKELYHTFETLYDNEIGLGLELAKMITSNPQELLGSTINVSFIRYLGDNNKYDEGIYTFKVKYIYDAVFSNSIICNESIMKDIYALYRADISNKINGVSIYKPSIKTINKLLNDNLDENMYKNYLIDKGISWLEPLYYIEFGIGIIMLLISIIIIVNFIHTIFNKEKTVLGLLSSLGINKNKIIMMYILDISLMVSSSFVLANILEVFANKGINYLVNKKITPVRCVYYNGFAPLIILSIFVFVIIFAYLIILKRLNKKEIVDIIYER